MAKNQGIKSRNVTHRTAGKSEPKPRAISPAAVNQLGAHVGSHTTDGRDTRYRGEQLVRGKGYAPPVGPTDNVKAVGVGGGRTTYHCGYQGTHGRVDAGNPTPKGELFPGFGPTKR
jgi:hypothetical protein